MAKIATLNIDLTASSAKFRDEMKRAEKITRKWRRQVSRDLRAAGVAFAGLGAAAAAGLTGLTRASLQNIDTLAKTSDKLGTTTEGLAGLRFAAEQTGNSAKNLDLGLQRMTRRIAEAAAGTGEAKAALKELGLDASALKAKRPEEAFRDIADAMAKVKDQSDRVRLGFKLFDAEGVGLVNTLATGRDGLQEFQEQAEKLGIAVNRVDAAKIEMANDAINRAKKVSSGLGNAIATQVAPIIGTIADRFTEASLNAGGFSKLVAASMKNIMPFIQAVADAILGIKLAWGVVSAEVLTFVNDLDAGLLDARAKISQFKKFILQFGAAGFASDIVDSEFEQIRADTEARMEAREKRIAELKSSVVAALDNRIAGPASPVADQLDALIAEYEQKAQAIADNVSSRGAGLSAPSQGDAGLSAAAAATQSQNNLYSNLIEKLERARDTQNAFAEGGVKLVEITKLRHEAEDAYTDAVDRAKAAYDKWFEAQTKAGKAVERTTEGWREFMEIGADGLPITVQQIFELKLATEQAGAGFKTLKESAQEANESISVYADQAARNMQSAFADFLFDPFDKGLKGMLKSFVDTLRRMVAEAAAAQLFNFLGGNKGGNQTGGNNGGGIGQFLGSLLGSFLPGFANGGQFKVGGAGGIDSQVVAFRATPGETVSIATPGGGSGSSAVINITNNVNVDAGSDIAKALPQILDEQNERTKSEISDLVRRGMFAA